MKPGTLVRKVAMRPRRLLVRAHRWVAIALLGWLVVIAGTGGWLAVSHSTDSWLHSGRYDATDGDVGASRAAEAAAKRFPDGATIDYVTLPRNGRGVYQVAGSVAIEGAPETDPDPYRYYRAFVDPGTGRVNSVVDEEAGLTAWLFRGHMYLWQDHGIAGVFDPASGWCRVDADGHEPGGVHGVVCDVIPTGDDMVAWFGVGWMVVLLTGFYLWYWPGVRRWANALRVTRGRGSFALNMSLHKVIGFVVWVPLMIITFTGVSFAFTNIASWYENVTPAQRDFFLWTPAEDPVSSKADGRQPIGLDAAVRAIESRYPERAIGGIAPPVDETGTYAAWVTRGFDPWTREGGAGNTWLVLDQYSGKTVYDGIPGEGNAFDQAWDDWSYPLHTGDFGGTATRVLWVGVALSPIALGVTGVVMNRIRAGKRRRRRPSEPELVITLDEPAPLVHT